MKILVFLQGTLIMHNHAFGKTCNEIIKQVEVQEGSVRDFGSYIPVGNCAKKLRSWTQQGAKIVYLSALTEDKKARGDEIVGKAGLKFDKEILQKYKFPAGKIYHRNRDESYAQIVEKLMLDILIEDNCESIGGEEEMIITSVKSEIKKRIKSIVVKEFEGVDHLPDNLNDLAHYQSF